MLRQEYEQKVMQVIDESRGKIIDFLQQIVSIPSTTGGEEEIQTFIATYCRKLGLAVDSWEPDVEVLKAHPDSSWPLGPPPHDYYKNRPNIVATRKGTGGGRSLILNGHVDVIPPGPESSWKHGQWSGEILDNKLYGRGSSDMKSGIAAMTMAVKTITQLGFSLKGDLILEYVVDEERGSNGTLACVLRGIRADGGICCETSSLAVQPAAIGRCWFEIIIAGKPAGVQRAWEGVNAIQKSYYIMGAIAELEEVRREVVGHSLYKDSKEALQMAVGAINAGSYHSSFPDSAILKGSFSTLPGEKIADVREEFEKQVMTAAKVDSWLRNHLPKISYPLIMESFAIPAKHPIVEIVSENFRGLAGKNPEISGRLGASGDTRYLNESGTPTVIFGPGNTAQMHANDEWTNVDDLIMATKVLALSILDWCGVE